MTRSATLLLVTAFLAGCRSAPPPVPRYIVTAAPLPLLGPTPPNTGFCVAVDPNDPKGVWWWEPGRTGCTSRSTGPDVFPARDAKVARSSSAALDVSFGIPLHDNSVRPISLEVHEDRVRQQPSGPSVSAIRRATLEMPESPPPIARRGAVQDIAGMWRPPSPRLSSTPPERRVVPRAGLTD